MKKIFFAAILSFLTISVFCQNFTVPVTITTRTYPTLTLTSSSSSPTVKLINKNSYQWEIANHSNVNGFYIYDRNALAYRFFINTAGNAGIGTTEPSNTEYWNRVLDVYGSSHSKIISTTSAVQTGLWSHNSGYYGCPAGGITGTWTNHPFSIVTNKTQQFTINTNGTAYFTCNVGIGTQNALAKLQVTDGIGRVAVGTAYSAATGYGIGYLGFNVLKTATNSWQLTNDGANNGGCMLYGDVGGNIIISCFISTGKTNQTFTDAQIREHARLILTPEGKLITNEIEVKANIWADDVFNDDYKLSTIKEVEEFINTNNHLPGVPSAAEINENGLNLGDMDAILLKKIEELTYYMIEQDKQIKSLQIQIESLKE